MTLTGVCIVAMEIGQCDLNGLRLGYLGEQIFKLRSRTPTATIALLAFGGEFSEDDVEGLIRTAAFDAVVQGLSPRLVRASAEALARLAEMLAKGERHGVHREGRLAVRVSGWSIDPDTRLGRRPDGSEVRLSRGEVDYILLLLNQDLNDKQRGFTGGDLVHKGVPPRAMVYKIKTKLGQDFPIESAGSGGYRIRTSAD